MNGKHVSRFLGVLIFVALGLIAFTAPGARAEALAGTRGTFKVLGSAFLLPEMTLEPEGQTTFLVPGYVVPFEVVCPKFVVLKGKLLAEGVAEVKFLYEECVAWNSGLTKVLPCKTGYATADLLLLVISHEKRTYVLAEGKNPKEEEVPPLVEFKNEKLEGCLLPDKGFVIRGSYAFELMSGDLQIGPEVVEPLIKAGDAVLQALLKDKLQFGVFPVTIDGSLKLKLVGAHLGCKWGAI